MDVVVGGVLAGIGGAGIAEGADIGLQASVGRGSEGGELDVVVLGEAVLDATHTEHAVGVSGGDDGLPLLVVGLVAGTIDHEHTFTCGEVAGFSHIGGAIHVAGVVVFFAVAEGGGDDIGAVAVGPFHGHLPPDLFLEGLGVDLGAGEEELGACGEAEVAVAHAAGDAGERHGAVGVPAVDIFFVLREVPGLENLVVVAEVLESHVGVDLRETAVEDGDADTLAVKAFVAEMLSTHADELCLEGAVDGGDVEETGEFG